MQCRFCGKIADRSFLDLGTAPPSNAFLQASELARPETWFPLTLHTCPGCLLVQTAEVESHTRLFAPDYVYFSSYSRSWLAHAERYVDMVTRRLSLDSASRVVEIASNDGYLLQYFRERDIPCLGIEPTAGTAEAARARGIETIEKFFGTSLSQELVTDRGPAHLVIGNNVLAHVPDINDFVSGVSHLLSLDGVATFEFPHLLELVRQNQFDTVYHEHFSYFSLHVVEAIFNAHGLRIWDVEQLTTHGGSLRVWACRDQTHWRATPAVDAIRMLEREAGMMSHSWYEGFQQVAESVKDGFLGFLLAQKHAGRRVVGYGAAAKGNTLLNFAGVRSDLLSFVVDASPHKQGRYLPGSRIPVLDESHLILTKPDYVVVLPWNLREEVTAQLGYIRDWGGRLVFAIPSLSID